MMGRIGCSNRSDRPKSPTRIPPMKAAYCVVRGRSSPCCRWNARTASALARSPRISRAGSPESRSRQNVTSVIPIQTRTSRMARARRYRLTGGPARPWRSAAASPHVAEGPEEVAPHDLPGVLVRVPAREEAERDVAHLGERVDLRREDPRQRRVDNRPVRLVGPVPELAQLRHHLGWIDLLREVRAEAHVVHAD